jgi:non-heme chloroperoxidase
MTHSEPGGTESEIRAMRASRRSGYLVIAALAGILAGCMRSTRPPQVRSETRPMTSSPTKIALSTQVALSLVERGDARARDVLVLLPGISDSWRSYEAVFPHLPDTIRTIAISQRGHGDSDKPQAHYSVRDYEADLLGLFDALGVRRAILVGHSSASLVARRFALDHPERVAGLVLEGSFINLASVPLEVKAKLTALTDPIGREFIREFTAGTFVHPPPPGFVDAMVDESLKAPARVWRETFASIFEYDDAKELPSLVTPTLLVWGDRDGIIDRRATEALAQSIRSSKLLTYEDIGHTPHWEAPQRFARDVAAFVAQRRGS